MIMANTTSSGDIFASLKQLKETKETKEAVKEETTTFEESKKQNNSVVETPKEKKPVEEPKKKVTTPKPKKKQTEEKYDDTKAAPLVASISPRKKEKRTIYRTFLLSETAIANIEAYSSRYEISKNEIINQLLENLTV